MEKLVKLNFKDNDQLAHGNHTTLCIILCAKQFLYISVQTKMKKSEV